MLRACAEAAEGVAEVSRACQYIGGDEDEDGAAVAVNAAGNVRVAGATESGETTFPDGDGFGALPGPDRTFNGSRGAFVVAIGPGLTGRSLYLPLILR